LSSYEKGVNLEKRASKWLTSQFGYKCSHDSARGKVSQRPYDIDIHGITGSIFKSHLWVECKAFRIKRVNVTKLIECAKDVKDLNGQNSGMQKWTPNMLMLIASEGFDIDAIGMADKYKIYCVHAKSNAFDFVGKKTRSNFENKEESSI
jgi:hypothetical protein